MPPGVTDEDHPEHLQKLIREICARLGFPESPEGNGQDLEEKLTAATYVLWQVLARICGIGSLEHYRAKQSGITRKQVTAFVRKCVKGSARFHPEFLKVVGRMMNWEPPKRK